MEQSSISLEGVRMKMTLLVSALFSLLVTACAQGSAATEEPSSPDQEPPPTNIPAELTPAQLAAVTALSENLGLSAESIKLISTEAVEWPDGCLGVQEEGVMCTQAIVPGFRILLEANGRELEYRANEDGTQVRPATVLMRWKREGGIAGFCDYITVYLSGEVHKSSCKGGESGEERLSDILSEEEIAKLDQWAMDYGTISIDASDPKGVSDRMVVTLEFIGLGNMDALSSTDENALLEFAQLLSQSSSLK
jgi:hypothetical protein